LKVSGESVIHEYHLRLPHGFSGAFQDLRLGGTARGQNQSVTK